MPTNELNATASVEFDSRYLAAAPDLGHGSYTGPAACRPRQLEQAGYIEQLHGFNDPRR